MHEDVKWLFGVLIIFAVMWFAAGGLNKAQTPFIDPYLSGENGVPSGGAPVQHIGSNSYEPQVRTVSSGGSTKTVTISGSGATQKLTTKDDIAASLREVGVQAEKIEKELDALEAASHASPLTKKLSIGGISGAGTANEYVILRAATTNIAPILITGLRLESAASGRATTIPKASPLPFQNQLNVEQPVYLGAGETAYIVTGRSPLGISFRPNKCTGFFNQYQSFLPSIPSRCPKPSERDLPSPSNSYSDACRDYINSLPVCRVITNPPKTISPECAKYVTTEINYTKCVEHHKNDKDFYDATWRLYLRRTDTLWKTKRELIHLFDSNGKTIDSVTF